MATGPANRPSKHLNLAIVFLVLLMLGGLWLYIKSDKGSHRFGNVTAPIQPQTGDNTPSDDPIPPSSPLPSHFSLQVPFTSQAPTANWDQLHNEACEEASAIMAYAYFKDISSLPAPVVENEITKLTQWETETLNYNLSITTEETAEMIESVYDLKTEIIPISEGAIKRALTEGKLVLVPANGRMLGNPNFKSPGPIYHMFVITGYTSKQIITNDPGTRKGEDYEYDYGVIEEATGNWNHEAHAVDLSDKRIIIVSK